ITDKFRKISQSPNLAIMNDFKSRIRTAYETTRTFKRSAFENQIRMRCQENDGFYREEFVYFSNFYTKRTKKEFEDNMNDLVVYYDLDEND
ncbi:hypothetical protein PENTCL1PPCAC_29065, partial [Pristionchus entomophagus]